MNLQDAARKAALGLPFVTTTDAGTINFWAATEYGHDDTDMAVGEHYANMALAIVQRLNCPDLVAVIMADMIRLGRLGGLEAGFIATVASAAKCGRLN